MLPNPVIIRHQRKIKYVIGILLHFTENVVRETTSCIGLALNCTLELDTMEPYCLDLFIRNVWRTWHGKAERLFNFWKKETSIRITRLTYTCMKLTKSGAFGDIVLTNKIWKEFEGEHWSASNNSSTHISGIIVFRKPERFRYNTNYQQVMMSFQQSLENNRFEISSRFQGTIFWSSNI